MKTMKLLAAAMMAVLPGLAMAQDAAPRVWV